MIISQSFWRLCNLRGFLDYSNYEIAKAKKDLASKVILNEFFWIGVFEIG